MKYEDLYSCFDGLDINDEMQNFQKETLHSIHQKSADIIDRNQSKIDKFDLDPSRLFAALFLGTATAIFSSSIMVLSRAEEVDPIELLEKMVEGIRFELRSKIKH